MVTVTVPAVAVLLAVNVNVLVVVAGFVLNDAVTPPGSPDADKLTPPLKPLCGVTVILVCFVKLPDEPVTVTVNAPMAAVALAVNVNVLVVVAGFVLNDAVTPLG